MVFISLVTITLVARYRSPRLSLVSFKPPSQHRRSLFISSLNSECFNFTEIQAIDPDFSDGQAGDEVLSNHNSANLRESPFEDEDQDNTATIYKVGHNAILNAIVLTVLANDVESLKKGTIETSKDKAKAVGGYDYCHGGVMPLMVTPPFVVFGPYCFLIAYCLLFDCIVCLFSGCGAWPYRYVHRAHRVRWRKILTVVSPLTVVLRLNKSVIYHPFCWNDWGRKVLGLGTHCQSRLHRRGFHSNLPYGGLSSQ